MHTETVSSGSRGTGAEAALDPDGGVAAATSAHLFARLETGVARMGISVPAGARISIPISARRAGIAALGTLAATGVGYVTSQNPAAAPGDLAVPIRVVIIVALIGAGLYAQSSQVQTRMGARLIAVGLLSSLWLLNGSSNRLPFSIGAVCSGVMPPLFAYLVLVHPTGHLRSRMESRFLWLTGGTMAVLWLLGVAMTLQPPLKTPLLRCGPHCPDNVFSLGSATEAVTVLQAAIVVAWLALTLGTPLLLARRARSAPVPARRSLIPVLIASIAAAILLTGSLILHAAGVHAWTTVGAVYVVLLAVLPMAILVGLSNERMFLAQALADFVSELVRVPDADPEAMMSTALRDPSLKVAYRRPGAETYVDSAGVPVDEPPGTTAITLIERERRPVAAVMYSADLSGFERFVQAAGAAALIQLERTQLIADLSASTANLASSRVRMMETANAERRRLERDLHDGIQQHLVGLRLRLDKATEQLKEDRAQGEMALAFVGQQMDDVLQELRLLARGIYPSLLHDRGLREALRSAARTSPAPVAVHAAGIGRYAEKVEVAVYFCCLEAIQNVVKHAGPDPTPMVTLWRDGPLLCLDVQDSGVGFDPERVRAGSGLVNMSDRLEAVGGTLKVTARKGHGTSVHGYVPVA